MPFFVSKRSRNYHFHKVSKDFFDIFLIDSKKSKKSDSFHYPPSNEQSYKKRTFLQNTGQKGPKKWSKKSQTKGYPFTLFFSGTENFFFMKKIPIGKSPIGKYVK